MNGYRVCRELLGLRRYERKRAAAHMEECDVEEILAGDEVFWRARMHAIAAVLGKMKNGREKLILYYHYIKGDSVERIALRLGVSRRTGYRIFQRGLFAVSEYLEEMQKTI